LASAFNSRSTCASSAGVAAKTYSLMKHCCASAPQNSNTASSRGLPARLVSNNARRSDVNARSSATSRTGVDLRTQSSSGSSAIAASPALPSN